MSTEEALTAQEGRLTLDPAVRLEIAKRKAEEASWPLRREAERRRQIEEASAASERAANEERTAREAWNGGAMVWHYEVPAENVPCPWISLTARGADLFEDYHAARRREQAEDRAAADEAQAAARNSEAHKLVERLERLQADTQAQLSAARDGLFARQNAARAALAAGRDPADDERAARGLSETVAALEARLQPLAGHLAKATDAAERVEKAARGPALAARREARAEAQRRREAEAGPKLEALLRELLGLDGPGHERKGGG